MFNINQHTVIGFVGQEPELRATKGGTPVASFSVATSNSRKNKETGAWEETETSWHNVVAWGDKAEYVQAHVHKGTLVVVVGKQHTRKWQAQDGGDRYTAEITAEHVYACVYEKRGNGNRAPHPADTGAYDTIQPPSDELGPPLDMDDLPPLSKGN